MRLGLDPMTVLEWPTAMFHAVVAEINGTTPGDIETGLAMLRARAVPGDA